jgi:hypothetical protein
MENKTNQAIIVALRNVRKHSNADRLQLATVCGSQVIIGLNHTEGELGVYFDSNLQLSKEFATANDLVRRKDENGKPAGGMFAENRKVKTQTFRGEKSDGFWIPLNSLNFASANASDGDFINVKEGYEFDTFNGFPICNKFVAKFEKTGGAGAGGGKKSKRGSHMFFEHYDTPQLARNLHKADKEAEIIITEKLHGCVDRNTIIETLELGEVTIGEIVDNKLDVRVKAMDTVSNQIVFVPIDDYYFYPNDTDWYLIELEDGMEITITGNNPVWLPELGCYRKVEALSGDEILLVD